MSDRTIGFIGGGRIVRILLGGWARSGVRPERVVVSDCDEEALARLSQKHPEIQTVLNDNAAAAAQSVVFLALHPPAIKDVLPTLKPSLRPDAILVSLAPKWTIAKLAGLLDGFDRIARMIPNAPSIVGAGFNPIAYAPTLPADDRRRLQDLLDGLGSCPEVSEPKLEAYAVLTAMGPTYLWPQLYALQSLGESFGLDAAEAAEGIRQMVNGTVATMTDSGLGPAEVQDLIPVKPLADLEQTIVEAYRTKLTGIMEKIKP